MTPKWDLIGLGGDLGDFWFVVKLLTGIDTVSVYLVPVRNVPGVYLSIYLHVSTDYR